MKNHRFTFMGSGAGCGVPAFFCECKACEEARLHPELSRGDCGAMVTDAHSNHRLLIDTPPDIRHYLNRENLRSIDEILYTHWHSDHVGGLLELEYMVQLLTKKELPAYATPLTWSHIAKEFSWMMYCLDTNAIDEFESHSFDGVTYTALPVTHAPGTVGYLIETEDTSLFYASDTGFLPEATKERLQGVDIIAMDATYWGNCPTDQHHSIQTCIDEGISLGAQKIYLTHLCMHYQTPITNAELDEFLKQYDGRVEAAKDGLSFLI